MTRINISKVPPSRHSETAEKIEEELLCSLADLNTQSTNTSVVMSANSDNGHLVGGVTGLTSYGWLLVKILWVSEECRGAGIGGQLMLAVEEEARNLGCHSTWLDTSNSQAREFYLRLGYTDFGVLENGPGKEPIEHRRWFMKKKL